MRQGYCCEMYLAEVDFDLWNICFRGEADVNERCSDARYGPVQRHQRVGHKYHPHR